MSAPHLNLVVMRLFPVMIQESWRQNWSDNSSSMRTGSWSMATTWTCKSNNWNSKSASASAPKRPSMLGIVRLVGTDPVMVFVFIHSPLMFKFIHCPLMFKEWYEGSWCAMAIHTYKQYLIVIKFNKLTFSSSLLQEEVDFHFQWKTDRWCWLHFQMELETNIIVPEFLLQAKKTGREPSPNDAVELERVTQEQAVLQKQLDSLRKQVKQHQMQTQDYRTKKRVSRGQRGAKKRIKGKVLAENKDVMLLHWFCYK